MCVWVQIRQSPFVAFLTTNKEAWLRGMDRLMKLELASDTMSFSKDLALTQRGPGMQSIFLRKINKQFRGFEQCLLVTYCKSLTSSGMASSGS